MKFHWGAAVAGGIVLFILLILGLVTIAVSSRVDLVTDRYYDKGIAYQQRINTLSRTAAHGEKLSVRLSGEDLLIEFPRSVPAPMLTGTITLYRPADKSRDVVVRIAPDSAGVQRLALAALDRGLWKLQIAWYEGDQEYYSEQPLLIN